MPLKRGEGAAKRRELSQRLRRIATGLRIEGAINMAGTLVQAAEVIEASSPSTLIAAVEAMEKELIDLVKSDKELEAHMAKIQRDPYSIGYSDAMGKARVTELHRVMSILKLLRAAPTEAVEDPTK